MALPFKSLTEVFADIELGLPWEPVFPPTYLQMIRPSGMTTLPSDVSVANTAPTAASTITPNSTGSGSTGPTRNRQQPSSTTPGDASTIRNEIVRNVNFNESVFSVYRAMNIKAKTLKDQLRTRNVEYPNNARGEPMCLTYHVHAMCNARCRYVSDHSNHTAAEDETLRTWCDQHYHLD